MSIKAILLALFLALPPWAVSAEPGGSGANSAQQRRHLQVDFNGDGKEDFLKLWAQDGTVNIDTHLSTGPTFAIQRWATAQGGIWDGMKWFLGDFNGDGRTDVMKLWNDAHEMTADVHLSTGSGFVIRRWATRQGGIWDGMDWRVGDFNGDGKTDLMKMWTHESQLYADVHLSTGSSFLIQRWATALGGRWDDMQWFLGDFNGDGKTDLMKLWNDDNQMTADVHLSTGTAFMINRWATKQGGIWAGMDWRVGDFNGDGKSDLMKVWTHEHQMYADVHLSTGGSFLIHRWATAQGGRWDGMRWYIGDFNGDGKSDLMKLWNDADALTADVHVSTGTSFVIQRWATRNGGFWEAQTYEVGDFNGDGTTDILVYWNDSGTMSADVKFSAGTHFFGHRMATAQGGMWDSQIWLAPTGSGFDQERNRIGASFVLYRSEYAAVQAALATVWDDSTREGLEYGGVVYKVRGSELWGFVVQQGRKHEIQVNAYYPLVSDVTAYWHTHPNRESLGASPMDLVAMIDEIKTKRLYTIVFQPGKKGRPSINGVGPTSEASGRKSGNINWPAMTPAEHLAQASPQALVCFLDSRDQRTYVVTLNDDQTRFFIRGTGAIVNVKYNFNGNNPWSAGVGPVTVSQSGRIKLSVFSSTLGILHGSVGGGISIPAILQGDWKSVFSAHAAAGPALGFELGGVGFAVQGGVEKIWTLKEEGPGNNWGALLPTARN